MRYWRDWTPGATFFFTAVTRDRSPLFADPAQVDAFRAIIGAVRQRRPVTIDAAVVFPITFT